MLQEAPDDGTNTNVVCQPRQLRWQHAGTAHQQVNLDAHLSGPDQGVDDLLVGQGVHLRDNSCLASARCQLRQIVDFLDQFGVQVKRCQQHPVQLGQAAVTGQVDKDVFDISRQQWISSQVTPVGVQARRSRVVIAGGQVRVPFELFALAARDEHHLGVRLQTNDAIQNLSADRLQHLGPVDVGLFVKAGFQLHDHGHFLAAPNCLAQQVHQFGVATGTVNGLLDSEHLGVVDGFAQETQHGVKTLERLMQHDIARFELFKKRDAGGQLCRVARLVGWKAELGRIHQVDQLRQAHQIDGAGNPVQGAFRQFKLLEQEI